ncbi:hypothetical protein JOF53_002257 [Crossiella equi]|uniref:Uncharacterized protein n=1 Tax=Crossiella equi TaxID=130796 RepID=A0ABS5A9W9_9PSEU|nr:DUF6247 family protein [Crossiella equi]MBP2473385.1 hypothetical protein [Crossiella equi]
MDGDGAQPDEVVERPLILVPKTGPAVHAALDGEVRAAFEEEFSRALERTAQDFDTEHLLRVIARWHPMAMSRANPDPRVDAEHRAWKERGENFDELLPAPEFDGKQR